MNHTRDHYTVLGLSHAATATQIKDAYRKHAKTAHPDAGGSVEAMARVNEAYKTLSNPAARRAYDEHRAAPQPETQHETTPTTHHAETPLHTTQTHPDEHKEADRIDRERAAWARNSAWEMARLSAPIAVGAIIITRFIITHASSPSTRQSAALLAYIPVYAFTLSLVFLISPSLRLVFADLVRHHRTTKSERFSILGLVLAFPLLAVIWVLFFSRS